MALAPIAYLQDWAAPNYFTARYDLASSGVPFEMRTWPEAFANEAPSWAETPAADAFQAAREKLAGRYAVEPDQVIITPGASGAIFKTALALSDEVRAGGAVVETPVYEPLHRCFRAFGADVRPLPRRAGDGWRVGTALSRAREVVGDAPCVIVTNPHNPSGIYEDVGAIARLADAVAPAWLLVDEVYLRFIPDGRSAFGAAPNIAVCSSLTKAWGLGWARFGWLIAPPALATRLERAQYYIPGLQPSAVMALGCWALDRLDQIYADATAHLTNRLDRVEAALADHPVLQWSRPAGELVISTLQLNGIDDDVAFAQAMLDECETALAPGSYFDAPGTIRLGTGARPDRFDIGLERLLTFAAQYVDRAR